MGQKDGLRHIVQLITLVIDESGVPPDQIGGIDIGCTGPLDVLIDVAFTVVLDIEGS